MELFCLKVNRSFLGMLFAGSILSMSVEAQQQTTNQPPLGESERQLNREQQRIDARQREQDSRVDVRLKGMQSEPNQLIIPEGESPCFVINDIQLIGDQSTKFQWLLKKLDTIPFGSTVSSKKDNELLGQCLGAKGINVIMTHMQNRLIERGYVTSRIVASGQDLKGGTLQLTLIPGYIRNILTPEGKWRRNVLSMRQGDLLNLRDIEQTLESIRRLPSVQTNINIVPSNEDDAKPGESDLVIDWEQGSNRRYVMTTDDTGSKRTGQYQAGLSLVYDNLFGLHDLMRFSTNQDVNGGEPSAGSSEYYGINFSFPYKLWETALDVNVNKYYQTVEGAFESYRYSGDSLNASFSLSRLLYRDGKRKLSAKFNTWLRNSKNFINDAEVEAQRRRTAGIEATLAYKQFMRSAILHSSITYRKGLGILGALPAPEEEFGQGVSEPSIIKADIQFNTPFTVAGKRFGYSGVLKGQYNLDPLIVQDRFSIGSRYTVRGFDGSDTLIGEKGWLLRNEFSKQIGNTQHSAYLGLDYGKVSGKGELVVISLGDKLAGATLGLRGNYKGFSYELFLSSPISKPEAFDSDVLTSFSINRVF